ncbi:hypothetical protein FD755_000900 [Muntiacus reevesi]|uniref:UAP56-interacting factor n=1 Tax=Muntiacus reevesi TaxID=9886 RepID=A0A5J5N1R7_MUNRE|nr:hypothetical protein FD755_000900 [Muntiacus reevesi]
MTPPKACSNENLNRIDMKEKQNFLRLNRRLQQSGARQFRMRIRWAVQQNSVMPGKRCPYGVITGLASRKNIEQYFPTLKRKVNLLRLNDINRKNYIPAGFTRSGNELSHQKDTRRGAFLFRRGLKVQAQLNSEQLLDDVIAKSTPCTAVPSFFTKWDVKKVPKGVPLQFEINSVGKQTGMTLNELFRIFQEQALLQSHSHQDSMVLAQRQKYRSMEQNRNPRDKPMYLWTPYL